MKTVYVDGLDSFLANLPAWVGDNTGFSLIMGAALLGLFIKALD